MIKKFFNFFSENKEKISEDPIVRYVQNLCDTTKWNNILNEKIENVKYIVLDTETTGVDKTKDSILSIAAIKIKNFKIVNIYNVFVNPEVKIPEESKKYHRIDDEFLKDKPKIYEIIPDFLKFIGKNAIIVGHHIKFDLDIINREILRYFNSTIKNPIIDTGDIFRFLHKVDKKVSLDEIIQKYLSKCVDRHSALGDALVTGEVFIKMVKELGKSFKTMKDLKENGLLKWTF